MWTRILHPHFRRRNLDTLDRCFQHTGNGPLRVRALLPWPANSIDDESFKNVALMLEKHTNRLRALHVRAVNADLVGPFLQHALFSTNRAIPCLEELDIAVKLDSSDKQVALVDVLQDAAESLPSLKTLSLPGYSECIPTPSPSSTFKNLINLRVNGTGLSNGSPLYELFRFLQHTPNLQTLFYKTCDQFSYQIRSTPPSGSWAPTKKYKPVSLPVFLPHLLTGDVSASGSGTDLLRNVVAPNLERVHLDGSRIQDGLEDWTMGLIRDVGDVLEELSRRSPNVRSITLTEIPLEEPVFKWILCGEERGGHAIGLPFRKLDELIVRDVELSAGQITLLSEDSDKSTRDLPVERRVGLTDTALAHYASTTEGVALRKLGIHHAKCLAPDIIIAAGRKGVNALARNGIPGPFVMEFMQYQGPAVECIKELEEIGVNVEWTEEVEGLGRDRSGWWTADFKIDECHHG